MIFIKNLINRILNKFDYKLINLKIRKQYNIDNTILTLLYKILSNQKKFCFFDVGANVGNFTKKVELIINKMNDNLSDSDKIISNFYLFEPNLDLNSELEKIKNMNIKIYNFGLGNSEETKNFFRHENHLKSSFLKANPENFDNLTNIKSVETKIDTLDNFCKSNKIQHINFLKIDTQGYNAKVLEGAKDLISHNKIDLIYSEINLGKKYENQESFYDIEKFLHKNFELYGLDIGNYYIQIYSRKFMPKLGLEAFYLNKNFCNYI